MAVALLGDDAPRLYLLEEPDNGVHPTRAHLVLDLFRAATHTRGAQVVATTHDPHLLRLLDDSALAHALFVYRRDDAPVSKVVRIVDIPHARGVLQRQELGRLHSTGWLENAVAFADEEAA